MVTTTKSVQSIMAELLDMPETSIVDELSMKTVESWDSLMQMQIVMTIEETFDMVLTINEIAKMQSVLEIKQVLHEHGIQ